MSKRTLKILVTGANGAVASDLVPILIQNGFKVLATDIDCPKENPFPLEYMDVRSLKDVKAQFKKFSPHWCIHLAAETDLEYCEIDPHHAYETNAQGTKNIASVCRENNVSLVYISSAGVFDGKKKGLYTEKDNPNPVNVYGKTKLLGEEHVRKTLTRYLIVRAGWMIGGGEKDKKFVAKILRLIRKGVKKFDVVIDKRGTPTYTVDLSNIIVQLIKAKLYGTYHVSTLGSPTRLEIAKRIIEKLKRQDIKINPVKSDYLKRIYFAPRPNNESLDSSKVNNLFPGLVRPWTERLDEYLLTWTGVSAEENNQKFSIVICFWVDIPRFYKDLKKFEKLKYRNFELIIVSDKQIEIPKLNFPARLVLMGKKITGVGEKRDFALKVAKGDFIAYIDDDAYPDPDWLSNALLDFKDPRVGAVGGPNITPREDSFWAKISGYIYESYFTSGGAQHRFVPKKKMTVPELQGVNLIIRKDILLKVGGFSTKLFSGDDTKVCYSIRLLGYEVLYDPNVIVYHHRREFPFGHLKQVKTIGAHRGFFVKRYPETSFYPIYFLPSFLTIGFFGGLFFSLISELTRILFVLLLGFAFLLGFLSIIKRAGIVGATITAIGIILTHLTYGIFFINGLIFVKELEH